MFEFLKAWQHFIEARPLTLDDLGKQGGNARFVPPPPDLARRVAVGFTPAKVWDTER